MSDRAHEAAADALFRALVALANRIFDAQVLAEDLVVHHERLPNFDRQLLRFEAGVAELRGAYERALVRRHQLDAIEALQKARGNSNHERKAP
jgi:hypothetical protein